MIPIRDHNPSGRTPYVTWALIAINVAVFLSYWPLFDNPRLLHRFFLDWGMVPAIVSKQGDVQGLFTSMFLHGGVMHLAGNMLFLWIFGDNLEDEMGHLRYLLFYLACGIGAGLAGTLAAAGDHSFQILLMCYAPGGVVEMGLIALSLGVSPMMVTMHHIVRIGFTVIAVPLIGRRFLSSPEPPPLP